MHPIPLKIPCKPHIRAFLEFHFGTEYVLSTNDFLGIMLFHLLKKQSVKYDKTKNAAKAHIYTDYFTVNISEDDLFHRTVNSLSSKTIIHFNNLIDQMISFFFKAWVNNKIADPPKYRKDAILQFMDDNGISEEVMTEDAFLKSYQRYYRRSNRLKLGKN